MKRTLLSARIAGPLLSTLLAAGCGGELEGVPPPAAVPVDPGVGGAGVGGAGGTGSGGSGVGGAGGSATGGSGGEAGSGPTGAAIGEPCGRHDDCRDRLCLVGMCRTPCDGPGCGANERCAVAPIGGARAGGCVPDGAGICQPCVRDGDCPFPGDLCLPLGDSTYCGRDCELDTCPSGFECTSGAPGGPRQCTPKSGDCGCSDANAGATRPCEVRNASGVCGGVERCDPTAGFTACDAATPSAERCNGQDDDCDGAADEDFALGGGCTTGRGACERAGVLSCDTPGTGTACSAVAGAPGVERCNAIDDDCDGSVDEDFPTLGQSCTVGQGGCSRQGNYACLPDGTVGCTAQAGNGTPEACNGQDDDCNGVPDDGFDVGAACSDGVGACRVDGQRVCNGAQNGTVCSAVAGAPSAEVCNGADDDCDGFIDDGLVDIGGACSTGQPGPCDAGLLTCQAGNLGCTPQVVPSAEICGDGVDQDCNGADQLCPTDTNDDCAAPRDITGGGTFTGSLVGLADNHAGCAGAFNNGPDAVFTFTLAVPSLVYLDALGSAFDTVLTVQDGACGGGAQVACNDDACSTQSQLVTGVLPAGTYYVWLDAYSGAGGAYSLTFQSSACTDAVALGTRLSTGSGTQAVDTTGQPATRTSSCSASGAERWFYLTTCPGTHSLNFDTCGTTTDTVLHLHTAGCDGAELACDDDGCALPASRLSSVQVGAGIYWLAVDGWGGAQGTSTLTWSITTP